MLQQSLLPTSSGTRPRPCACPPWAVAAAGARRPAPWRGRRCQRPPCTCPAAVGSGAEEQGQVSGQGREAGRQAGRQARQASRHARKWAPGWHRRTRRSCRLDTQPPPCAPALRRRAHLRRRHGLLHQLHVHRAAPHQRLGLLQLVQGLREKRAAGRDGAGRAGRRRQVGRLVGGERGREGAGRGAEVGDAGKGGRTGRAAWPCTGSRQAQAASLHPLPFYPARPSAIHNPNPRPESRMRAGPGASQGPPRAAAAHLHQQVCEQLLVGGTVLGKRGQPGKRLVQQRLHRLLPRRQHLDPALVQLLAVLHLYRRAQKGRRGRGEGERMRVWGDEGGRGGGRRGRPSSRARVRHPGSDAACPSAPSPPSLPQPTFFLTSIEPSLRSNSFFTRAFSASSSCGAGAGAGRKAARRVGGRRKGGGPPLAPQPARAG